MSRLAIELLTDLDNLNYDIHDLQIEIINHGEDISFSTIEMRITIIGDEIVFDDDEADEALLQYLFGPFANSHEKMLSHIDFPLYLKSNGKILLNIELDIPGPLIDRMKYFPDYLLDPKSSFCPKGFIMQIIVELTDIKGEIITERYEKEIGNPWHPLYQK